MAELLCVKDLTKVYGKRGAVTRALDGVDLSLEAGEYVGIMGASGLSLIHISEPTRP